MLWRRVPSAISVYLILALAILGAQLQLTAGYEDLPEGACIGGDNCCSNSSPCGAGEGDCDNDDDCEGDLKCGEDNCNRAGYSSFDSTDDCCQRDCPSICTSEYKPVCGSDGKTYINKCELEIATCTSGGKIKLLHDGECQNFCGDPYCDQTCVEGEICEATDYKCVQSPCCLAHRCVEECPESCPDYDDPICGSDGKTYFCHCNLRMANCNLDEKITKVHNGACEDYVSPANISVPTVKRCTGGDSCCSKDEVCGLGEGDCDTDADCGQGLKCGTDNCQGTGFDSTDDCCMLPGGGLEVPKGAERIIYTLPGKEPLSYMGFWPTQAVQLDNLVYFSGILGMNHTSGEMVQGVRLQARQMFDNMEALMNLMGIDMTRGLKATLFMTNIDEAEVVLKVWLEECNWKEYPALTLAQVSALPHGAQMQVDLIAVAGRCNTLYHTIDQNPDRPTARTCTADHCPWAECCSGADCCPAPSWSECHLWPGNYFCTNQFSEEVEFETDQNATTLTVWSGCFKYTFSSNTRYKCRCSGCDEDEDMTKSEYDDIIDDDADYYGSTVYDCRGCDCADPPCNWCVSNCQYL